MKFQLRIVKFDVPFLGSISHDSQFTVSKFECKSRPSDYIAPIENLTVDVGIRLQLYLQSMWNKWTLWTSRRQQRQLFLFQSFLVRLLGVESSGVGETQEKELLSSVSLQRNKVALIVSLWKWTRIDKKKNNDKKRREIKNKKDAYLFSVFSSAPLQILRVQYISVWCLFLVHLMSTSFCIRTQWDAHIFERKKANFSTLTTTATGKKTKKKHEAG